MRGKRTVATQREGFTLLEIVVAVLIVGILASLVSPSLTGWRQKYNLINTTNDLAQAIAYLQRESVRRNAKIDSSSTTEILGCQATLSTTGLSSSNCGIGSYTLPSGIKLDDNSTFKGSFAFSPLGTITKNGYIYLENSSLPNTVSCIRIEPPLGLIRTGIMESGRCTKNHT